MAWKKDGSHALNISGLGPRRPQTFAASTPGAPTPEVLQSQVQMWQTRSNQFDAAMNKMADYLSKTGSCPFVELNGWGECTDTTCQAKKPDERENPKVIQCWRIWSGCPTCRHGFGQPPAQPAITVATPNGEPIISPVVAVEATQVPNELPLSAGVNTSQEIIAGPTITVAAAPQSSDMLQPPVISPSENQGAVVAKKHKKRKGNATQ